MADLTPRQRQAIAAPALGIALFALGAVSWVAGGHRVLGMLLGLLGLAAVVWGLTAQRRDPVLRRRAQPLMRGSRGAEGGRGSEGGWGRDGGSDSGGSNSGGSDPGGSDSGGSDSGGR